MSKKKSKTQPRTNYEVWRSMRRDWGELSPVTRVIPNKKKNQKEKHKGRIDEE